ncbi:uncharacterized protein CEXT_20841 [Caerostris extrusa]|uniref:Uncharacterized protein n=1 Tax=Caerostris extrusa TaxID=172846 RepID=A0AAV4MMF2_CAEEX|nr:uncharacterized protein CEXT_20841 [Caerostris extrusa]
MRVVRFRLAALVGVAFLVLLCFHSFLSAWMTRSPNLEEIQRTDEAVEQACRHPDLDHNNPLILKHIVDMGDLECKRETDWIKIHDGSVSINPIIAKRHGKVKCKLTFLKRVDDFSSVKDKIVDITPDMGPVPLAGDFFHAKCESKDGLKWTNIMAGIHRNKTAVDRAQSRKPPPDAMNLNVLMFGLDSMSRLHYKRKLPKTYKYLKEVLKASVLKGYNIVGDGTPQALIPMLTGYTELELPETRKRMNDANFVNVYPFAWKNFTASGYVTAYGEDVPYTGVFTYRLKGFDELPTDHYMRSFYIEMEKVMKEHPKLCLGNTPRHKVMLDWLRHFYDVYSDVPKFAFGFHGELSHDDYNLVGYADSDLERFLKALKESGILNNTLLIMLSDHGHRFASIREMQQGKQEERLPFFAVVVPPWLEKVYPNHVRNLRINENRLVTPFDIHATLMTLLNPDVPSEGDLSSRSISIFSEIPQERTCTMASIEPHWCACLSWAKMSVEDPIASEVGQAVIDFVNELTNFQRQNCELLRLQQVTRIEKLQPNKALLKFRKNADKDGFVGEFSDNTQLTDILFQVQLRAFPSDAVYEASVKHDTLKKTFIVKESELSRVNMYGNQEHCIHDTYPNLRKYCYCKKQL